MSTNDYYLRQKYNPDGSDLRRAQLRMLEMLCFLDETCRKHSIDYWLDYGTLIGAARHGGFIPWDDDMDICMTRENLVRFRKVMQTNPSSQFVLQNHDTDPGYYRFWDVLRDLKSEYVHVPDIPTEHNFRFRGLQIDIFPFEDSICYHYHRFLAKYNNAFIYNPLLEKRVYKHLKFLVPFNFSLLRYVFIPIGQLIGKALPSRNYLMMSYGNPFSEKKLKKHIFPLSKISFEGGVFLCPNDVDSILSAYYGEWKEIPDEEHIRTHGVKFIFK